MVTVPAIVRGTVRHHRRTPFAHSLSFRTYQWLIDVDSPPRHTWFASFPVSDHFAGHAGSLREAVTSFAAAHGSVVHPSDRILMLAAARTVGHVFDPLSVFWCLDAEGATRFAVLEIHNTYGDRHAHLVHPDSTGRARMAKEFYVSPFFTIKGSYDVALVLTDEKVFVSVNLEQDGRQVFSASFAGQPLPVTTSNQVRAFLRAPFMSWQTSIRIRIHGIWLWLRRLPVISRPVHEMQDGFR